MKQMKDDEMTNTVMTEQSADDVINTTSNATQEVDWSPSEMAALKAKILKMITDKKGGTKSPIEVVHSDTFKRRIGHTFKTPTPIERVLKKVGRNEKCMCEKSNGTLKFKHCCGK